MKPGTDRTCTETPPAGCCGGSEKPCCCGGPPAEAAPPARDDARWVDGVEHTAAGDVPRVSAELDLRDRLGTVAGRFGVRRMDYRIPPGLYAVGRPTAESAVLVSANYKMSFDRLRSVMAGRAAWILVLDTKGINVWCAAGKGTFGTDEIVRRVEAAALAGVVSHRKLVVPQLGAPGVSAHEVLRRSGFRVEYGPVRAEDLPAFLDAGMKATPDMRRVRFGLRDRAVLAPIEIVNGGRRVLLVAAALTLLGGVSLSGYSLDGVRATGLTAAFLVLAAFLGGCVLGPVLLPWLPGRAFSVKGAVLGLAIAAVPWLAGWPAGAAGHGVHAAAWVFIIPAITSFVVMNFTGASTYTSLSGVLEEMRFAVPAQIAAGVIGLGLWLTGLFLGGGHTP